MSRSLSTASNFHNSEKLMLSPDNVHRLVYYNLNEISMGGPLAGECYLETKEKQKAKIHDMCGGPPAWETGGKLVAVPIWIRDQEKGLVQHIGVVNVVEMELTIFSRMFSVVELRGFEGEVVNGEVGDVRGRPELRFAINKEEILETMK